MNDVTVTQDEATFCEVHPDRETGLRCNLCGRLMCSQCAVPTPIGYRCQQCVRKVDDSFFNSIPTDPAVAFAIAAAGVGLAGYLLLRLRLGGLILLLFFIAVPLGGILAQVIHRAVGKRRGRYTAQAGAAGALAGALLVALLTSAFASIGLWVLAGLVAVLVYGRFQLK